MEFVTICNPDCNQAILLQATQLPFILYGATLHRRIWEGTEQDGTTKHTHIGWCEFERVCTAFQEAGRVETLIEPDILGNIRITVSFFKGGNPCTVSKIDAYVDPEGKTFIVSSSMS